MGLDLQRIQLTTSFSENMVFVSWGPLVIQVKLITRLWIENCFVFIWYISVSLKDLSIKIKMFQTWTRCAAATLSAAQILHHEIHILKLERSWHQCMMLTNLNVFWPPQSRGWVHSSAADSANSCWRVAREGDAGWGGGTPVPYTLTDCPMAYCMCLYYITMRAEGSHYIMFKGEKKEQRQLTFFLTCEEHFHLLMGLAVEALITNNTVIITTGRAPRA